MAATIAELGQLQPVLVRKVGQRYELVDGERRWRAIKSLGYDTLRAEIHDFSDAEARAIVLVSALQRKELNAIEEARAFRAALDAGDAPGPTELARRLGLSQGHVSNRLRLLGLPESIQRRILSREIPPTHARLLLPLKDFPKLAEAAAKEAIGDDVESPPTLEDFQRRIGYAVQEHCRAIGKAFKPTEEQRAQLGIVTVASLSGSATEYATNTKLFDQIQEEHNRKRAERDEKRQAKAKASAKNPETLTPAQRKQLEEEEARRQEEQAQQFARQLYDWKIAWLQFLIAQELPRASEDDLLRLLLMFAASWPCGSSDAEEWLTAAIEAAGGKVKQHKHRFDEDLFSPLAGMFSPEVAAADFVARCFWDPNGGPTHIVPEEDVEAVAEHLGIDQEDCWRDEQAGPLSEAYWNLHTKEQLQELAAELKVELPTNCKKAEAVQAFLARMPSPDDSANDDAAKWLALPREIKKAKRPR